MSSPAQCNRIHTGRQGIRLPGFFIAHNQSPILIFKGNYAAKTIIKPLGAIRNYF